MVLSAPPAAEGQAAAGEWLRALRRWLHLGREGVIVMIRDAAPARLRMLWRALREIDAEAKVTADAEDLMSLEPGTLVLLIVHARDLEWLNINRPIVAQRALRLVLWTEGAVSDRFKFESPDLHDWVSHFIKCPPGVPEFAVEGLRIGSRWWPGVAWRGPGLELALGELGIGVETLEPDAAFAGLLETLSADRGRAVRWVGVDSLRKLWRVRWAIAEARHHGFCVLDQPSVSTPGWFPVTARQLRIEDGQLLLGLEDAIEAEFEAEWVELKWTQIELETQVESGGGEASAETLDEASLREVGLLLRPGPRLRRMHESTAVERWRRALVAKIRADPQKLWSRHEQALFASLERDQMQWPDFMNDQSKRRHFVEWGLRMDPAAARPLAGLAASGLADVELRTRWPTRDMDGVDVLGIGVETWEPPSRDNWSADWNWGEFWQICRGLGWDTPFAMRAAAIYLSKRLDEAGLAEVLRRLQAEVEGELGADDASRVQYVYMSNIARALAGDPWTAREQLEALLEGGLTHPPYALPVFAAIGTLCGDYQESARYLEKLPLEGPPQLRLYLANLLAAGQPEQARAELQRLRAIDADPRDYLGSEASAQQIARDLLLARLHAY